MTMFSRFIAFLKWNSKIRKNNNNNNNNKKLVENIQDRTVLTFDMAEIIQGVARWTSWNFSKVTIIILGCKY